MVHTTQEGIIMSIQQWISAKMKVCHPWKLKNSKSWGPFLNYQLNSTTNLAHFAHFLGKLAGLAAGSSKTASRIWIFSIAMCANYSFEVKNIEIWLLAFFKHNNSAVATVGTDQSLGSQNWVITVPSVGTILAYSETTAQLCLIQNFMKPHKILAHSDNFFFHFFYWLSE